MEYQYIKYIWWGSKLRAYLSRHHHACASDWKTFIVCNIVSQLHKFPSFASKAIDSWKIWRTLIPYVYAEILRNDGLCIQSLGWFRAGHSRRQEFTVLSKTCTSIYNSNAYPTMVHITFPNILSYSTVTSVSLCRSIASSNFSAESSRPTLWRQSSVERVQKFDQSCFFSVFLRLFCFHISFSLNSPL